MQIASLSQIYRFPVKGLGGHGLDQCHVGFSGLAFDRCFALTEKKPQKPNFPWASVRDHPEFWGYYCEIKRSSLGCEGDLENLGDWISHSCFEGQVFSLKKANKGGLPEKGKSEWKRAGDFVSELRKEFSTFHVVQAGSGYFDEKPISIISRQSLSSLAKQIGSKEPINPLRFRPNFVFDFASGDGEHRDENALIGKTIKIGNKLKLMIAHKNIRCPAINFDPENEITEASKGDDLLSKISKLFKAQFGVYAVVLEKGSVQIGDSVSLQD